MQAIKGIAERWQLRFTREFKLKAVPESPAGSHYTEPAGMNHFAETRDEPVIAECTAIGPTGTTFVNPADDPRRNQ
ncbi:MAG: hypothetical protein AABM64_00785 [Pseudomonadota bacterium]